MSIINTYGNNTPGAKSYPNEVGQNVISGGVATYSTDASGNVTGLMSSNGVIPINAALNNVGTRAWGLGAPTSNTFNAVTGASPTSGQFMTFGATFEVATEYDAVRVIMMGASASTIAVNSVTIAPCTDISTTTAQINNAGFSTPTQFLFNGSSTVTVPIGTVTAPALVMSDWLPYSSTSRTDGGTMPLVSVRAAVTASASAGATPFTYFNKQTGTDWNTGIGKFYGIMSGTVGDFTNTSVFAGAYATGVSVVFGVQYRSRRGVMSTLWVGDSITASTSVLTTRQMRGFPVQSCQNVSTDTRPVEFAVAGFSGTQIPAWRTFLEALYAGPTGGTTGFTSATTNLQALSPTHLVINSWSTNLALVTVTQAVINTMIQEVSRMVYGARQNGIIPVLWTGIPKGNGVPYYDGTDITLRQPYLVQSLTYGYFSANFGNAVTNVPAGSGQLQYYISGLTPDGTHPNDAGDTLITVPATQLISQVAQHYFSGRLT